MSVAENGNSVLVHYRGTFNDGTEFDSSHSRGEPIGFKLGSGQMIAGFNDAVVGMSVGDKKSITLNPDLAYGELNEDAFKTFERNTFPEEMDLTVGAFVQGTTETGQRVLARVHENAGDNITLDFNHPMAGKELTFEIELMEITEE